MRWNDHSREVPKGAHAFLSPSQYQWTEYDEEKLFNRMKNYYSQAIGTSLHALAEDLIKKHLKLRKNDTNLVLLHLLDDKIPRYAIDIDAIFENFRTYVNDSIGFGMSPEVNLFYSKFCFGTADAIRFEDNRLMIFDLKTGQYPASLRQLEVYAALFCLEYDVKPGDIDIELRVYQNNDILCGLPAAEDILPIMDTIIRFDKLINKVKEEAS